LAPTTYTKAIFVDRPDFARALSQAEAGGFILMAGDLFAYMRRLDSADTARCMKILDAATVDIINARDGRSWSSYSGAEKTSLCLAAQSAALIHGKETKRGLLRKNEKTKPAISDSARERASLSLSRRADQRALNLEPIIEAIIREVAPKALTPTLLMNKLNDRAIPASRGGKWSVTTAQRALRRIESARSKSAR
jgi:hypothetical protein